MLVKIYENNIARMKSGANAGGIVNPLIKLNPPPKLDTELIDGFAEVLRSIAEQPQGVISVSVKEADAKADDKTAADRENQVRTSFTLKLFEGVGKELAFYVQAPEDTPGLIDISYKFVAKPGGFGTGRDVIFTVKFRKNPDNEPVKTATWKTTLQNTMPADMARAAEDLGLRTAGQKKPEPPPMNF
jgi:hypothetical protein